MDIVGKKEDIGAKANNLLKLEHADCLTPDSIAISASLFDEFLSLNKTSHQTLVKLYRKEGFDSLELKFNDYIFSEDFKNILEKKLSRLPKIVIIRSSADIEDGEQRSYAGVFRSMIVKNNNQTVLSSIRQIYANTFKTDIYLQTQSARMGILIQNVIGEEEDGYVAPEYGGVIFTQNPYLPHHCLIEISPGMPISSTYSGRPSLYVLDTRKKSIVYKEERAANVNWGWAYNNSTGKITKKAYLRNTCENWITTHLPAVNNIVDKLTNKFGKLLDIEFAFHKGQFVILQIRPICLKPHKPIRYSPIELRKIYSEKNYNLMKPIYSLPCLIIVHDKLITNKTIISIDKKFSEGYILMLQNIDNFLGGSLSEAGYPAFTKLIRNCKLIILLGQYNRQNHGTIIARELGIDTCFLNKPIIFKLFRYLKYKSPKTIIECSDFKIVFNTSTYDVTFYSNQLFDYLKKMIKS